MGMRLRGPISMNGFDPAHTPQSSGPRTQLLGNLLAGCFLRAFRCRGELWLHDVAHSGCGCPAAR
jgi:hypothetical protein